MEKACGCVMLLLISVVSVNGAASNNVQRTVTKARCYANCLTEVVNSSGPDPSCHGKQCKECIKPCQVPFTTIQKCKSTCVNSPICKKSCDFLHLKRNADILQGKNSITKQPGIPVEVTKNITSITLSWKPANASEGNVVYLLKERLSGDFNVPLSYFSDLVFFKPKAVLSVKQVCTLSRPFRYQFKGLKFYFEAVALTENSSLVASSESSAMEMPRPNRAAHIANPHFRYDPTSIGDKLRLTTKVTPSAGQGHLITRYGLAWKMGFCQSDFRIHARSALMKDASRNVKMLLWEKLKTCNHTLKVYSLMECIPSLPKSLNYEYKGCRFVENFNKSFCYSFDPPPTPVSAREVRNLSHSSLQVTDDFRVNTSFFWLPPTFAFGPVKNYDINYEDEKKLFWGVIWNPIRTSTTQTFLSVTGLLPNITVRVEVIPEFPNVEGEKRSIRFRTPAVPQNRINVKNIRSSSFIWSKPLLLSANVTWERPKYTNGLLGYQITINKRNVTTTKTSHVVSRLNHKESLTVKIRPLYKHKWIKPDGAVLNIETPAPDVKDLLVRNLTLSGYSFNKIDKTYDVTFSWRPPVFACDRSVDIYQIHYHLIGQNGYHVHCPSHIDRCPPPTTTSTNYLIPRVSPSHYIIIAVKPVFKDSPFVQGLDNVLTIEPLKPLCDGKGVGYFKDPTSCTSFYKCDGYSSKSHRVTCPRGLYWNQHTTTCDWPGNVDCQLEQKDVQN